MEQLSLLDLSSAPAEPELAPVVATAPLSVSDCSNDRPANRHVLAWLEAKADYYLKLMNRLMDAKRISQEVKTAEIVRVYELREDTLAKFYELERGQ